jgi:hypothetical protein
VKNIDGIKKPKSITANLQPRLHKPRLLKIDSIVKRTSKKTFVVQPRKNNYTAKVKTPQKFLFLKNIYSQKKVPVAAAVLALIIAFVSGMWSVWDTNSSIAESQPEVLGESTTVPNMATNSADAQSAQVPVVGSDLQGQNDGSVGNNVLFNTPIEYLQNYFQSTSQPDIINARKNKLEKFLTDMRSPLASASETIAEQTHWQLILAIAFAESTLGKNCADNNCSNIGVKPGAPSWRQYSSYSAWVVDFNRLLDKKYNDWTLEQMCGVYVKPCNPNWLLATQQILDKIKQQGIK